MRRTAEPAPLEEVKAALRSRLMAVAHLIAPAASLESSTAGLLHQLAVETKRTHDARKAWLLFIAVSASFPKPNQLTEMRRRLSLARDSTAMMAVLEATVNPATLPFVGRRSLEVVEDSTVVDVNFCATWEHNTGIQRVVRQTMPIWHATHKPVTFVAWIHDSTAMRRLLDFELDRVLNWNDRQLTPPARRNHEDEEPVALVVPWNCRVFLPEVPMASLCEQLACVAEHSGNVVSLIGYDAIPLVSAEGQSNDESERFAHYLTIVKRAHSVAAISESAAEEFRGFGDALPTQGIPGPIVRAIPLALETPVVAPELTEKVRERPLVLCVGSHEPRKNQEGVLYAAEALFNQGVDFELVFVGGGSASVLLDFDRRVRQLNARGFRVRSLRRASDNELLELYRRARFTAFISLHEGYGLPVAESLALGTPVLTSNFGSLAEIAAAGGCVMVNPRDDVDIVDGFRRMLTDDDLIERLEREAREIPSRSWSTYADELWAFVESSKAVDR
ncbi:glycosyltransferase family 1 protein [Salinibacterium sp. ZJ454]|uniref:glycosyltransferase family 4 protein n=1 Tax=Salinibacterium sp. ZJ454 TaxID=2708339 RepID=UPI001AB03149|nr:glycosyltransferase family 1 protein [Salinibacterium sp. ZJ454]